MATLPRHRPALRCCRRDQRGRQRGGCFRCGLAVDREPRRQSGYSWPKMTAAGCLGRSFDALFALECFRKDTTRRMCGTSHRDRASTWGLLLVSVGCSSPPPASARDIADANDLGRTLAAVSDTDRALLRQLPSLPSGTPRRVGDTTVVAEAPYSAASGRSCRTLHVNAGQARRTTERLACSIGSGWFFVPEIVGAAESAE